LLPSRLEQESLSPVEHIAGALAGWLNEDPRKRRTRFRPIGVVLFYVIAGVTLVVVAGLIQGFYVAGSQDLDSACRHLELGSTTSCLALLRSSLLGWSQSANLCDELEECLLQDETERAAAVGDRVAYDTEQRDALRHELNQSRIEIACIGFLAVLTAAAAVAECTGELRFGQSFFGRSVWYSYVFLAGSSYPGAGAMELPNRPGHGVPNCSERQSGRVG
jgi:hypothetical protein